MFVNMDVITTIITSTCVSCFIIWLSKAWISERLKNAIKNEYDQKLETHKAQLQAANDIELEKLRSNLNILALERQIEYSKLYEKRADAITEVYSLLSDVYTWIQEYTKVFVPVGDLPIEERRHKASEAYNKYISVYHHNRIFIPAKTAGCIDALNNDFRQVFYDFFYGIDQKLEGKGNSEKWFEIFERMNGPILKSLSELENDFRSLLGEKENESAK